MGRLTSQTTPEYRLLDHLGSLAVQTDNSGKVTGANVFLPFGQLVSSTTNDSFQFTGLEQDTENGSDHGWYRNYSTAPSRWLRPDPYNGSYDLTNPQSFNRYSYVGNNPLRFTDPSGLHIVGYCKPGCSSVLGSGNPNGGMGGDGEFATYDWVDGGNGAYGYSSDTWDYVMQDGYGGGITDGLNGELLSASGDVVGYVWQTLSPINSISTSQMLSGNVSFAPSNAPNNGQKPQQPQKNPCPTGTRMVGVGKALWEGGDALISANLAGIHFFFAGAALTAGCLDPTPFEPATCAGGVFVGGTLGTGGATLTGLAVHDAGEAISGIKQAFTCEP